MIASVMLAWRILLATSDPDAADVIEHTILNGVLSGLSAEGTHFFYVNPLQRRTHRVAAEPGTGDEGRDRGRGPHLHQREAEPRDTPRQREREPSHRLVTVVVDAADADAYGDEPVLAGERVVGFVTSGGYGHHVRSSIALGYVPAELASPEGPGGRGFEIEIIGRRRPARLQPEPLFDPQGVRMRA